MANKIKETEWVVPEKKDILDLIALQEGVPIEQLLAHVALKPPNVEHNPTQFNRSQCQTNETQIRRSSPFG